MLLQVGGYMNFFSEKVGCLFKKSYEMFLRGINAVFIIPKSMKQYQISGGVSSTYFQREGSSWRVSQIFYPRVDSG